MAQKATVNNANGSTEGDTRRKEKEGGWMNWRRRVKGRGQKDKQVRLSGSEGGRFRENVDRLRVPSSLNTWNIRMKRVENHDKNINQGIICTSKRSARSMGSYYLQSYYYNAC